ncbi:MAG: NfeD family protein [Pirellulaceae bacterium]|nr:NfeD family protein [Pirellulaceae bacterium]
MDPLLIAILCFLLAGALAAADLLVPSGGSLALASLLAATVSIFFAFRSSYIAGVSMLVLLLVAIPVFLVVAIRIWPYTPIGRRVILKAPVSQPVQSNSPNAQLQELIGQVGVVQSPLMPYGFVRINRRNYNATCESGSIDAGQNVQVIAVQQRNLVVAITNLSPTTTLPADPSQLAAEVKNESLLDRPANELGLDSLD